MSNASDVNETGMERISFGGISADQFDGVPALGDHFVMTVRCQVVSRTDRVMANEGVRHIVSVKVEDCVMGHSPLPEKPDQTTIDDIQVDNADDGTVRPEYGDYDPAANGYQPEPAGDTAHDNPFQVVP